MLSAKPKISVQQELKKSIAKTVYFLLYITEKWFVFFIFSVIVYGMK